MSKILRSRAGLIAGLLVILGGCSADRKNEQKDLKTAKVEMDNGAPMAALKLLQHRVQSHPEDIPTLLALGRANADLGRYQPAILFFKDVLAKDHDSVEAMKGLARIDLRLMPDRALTRLQDMARRFPRDPQIWTDLGVAYDYAGQHKQAQTAYYTAMKLDPLLIAAQSNLGFSYALNGQYDSALFMLSPLAASPDATPKIRANLAYAQFMSGNVAAARQTLQHDMSLARAEKVLDSYRQLGLKHGSL